MIVHSGEGDACNQISGFALKIACFQVSTGYERPIIEELTSVCEKQDEISDFVILKSFGHYDLILLYVTPNFGSHLSKTPPVNGVLKTNLFFCNFLGDFDPKAFIEKIRNSTFTGISFVKIDPFSNQDWVSIYNELNIQSSTNSFEKFIVGTLGWNEYIMFLCGEKFSDITDSLFDYYEKEDKQQDKKNFLKSLSYFCINQRIVPKPEWLEEGFIKTNYEIENLSNTSDILLDVTSISVSININSALIKKAIQFWKSADFKVLKVLGKDDLLVEPTKSLSLASFLSYLFVFRYDFRSKLVGTTTHIAKNADISLKGYLRPAIEELTPRDRITYSQLKEIFGDAIVTSNLNNVLEALYGLTNSPIASDAFSSLNDYPQYLIDIGKAWSNDPKFKKYNSSLANNAIGSLKKGIENRSFGTHGNIEEIVHGRLSKLSGGFQRAIVAVECIPAVTMFKTGAIWKGFAVLGDNKFYHANEVIGLPETSLCNVNEWWPLYHEIGHILIDRTRNDSADEAWISTKSLTVETFLTNRNNKGEWLKLLTEFTAEVLGFEFGFFGDTKLFFRLLWSHLNEVIPIEEEVIFKSYLLRSFFVLLFEEHFRKVDEIKEEEILSQDFLYSKFLEHITDVEGIIKKNISRKHFIAGVNSKIFVELYPFMKHLYEKMEAADAAVMPFKYPGIRADKETLNSDLTNEILKSVTAGKVWINYEHKTIPYEAVLYHVFKSGEQDLRTNIAIILTFWHMHMDFKKFLKKTRIRQ